MLATATVPNMQDWSKIPKQTLLKEKGQVGDCWRCCIAAVVGMPAAKVPHFVKDSEGGTDANTQKWLNDHGYMMIQANKLWFPRWHGSCVAHPVICCGPTNRSSGMGQHHAVVYFNDKIVYDPHPSESGLTAITTEYLIFKK